MTTWTPRPAHPDEPACWSWPLPPTRTRDEELARLLAEQEAIADPSARRSPGAIEMSLGDMPIYWFIWFHAGRCALCGHSFDRCGGAVIDHCHRTGMWRAKLGKGCNFSEGRGSSLLLDRYRAWHPAAILGLYEPYSGTGWTNGWSWFEHGAAANTNPPRQAPGPWPPFEGEATKILAELARVLG